MKSGENNNPDWWIDLNLVESRITLNLRLRSFVPVDGETTLNLLNVRDKENLQADQYTINYVGLTIPKNGDSSPFEDIQNDPFPISGGYTGQWTLNQVALLELSPTLRNENDDEIAGSEKPLLIPKSNPMVEINPVQNRIAHRELFIKVANGGFLNGKEVTWSMDPLFSLPPTPQNPGPNPASFRGDWSQAGNNHINRFEPSADFGPFNFQRPSQEEGRTKFDNSGQTATRINLPPIGFNKARIKIDIETVLEGPIPLIDFEVPAIVVVDPGHGGSATVGGSSPNNAVSFGSPVTESDPAKRVKTLEKTLVLSMGLSLREKLVRLGVDEGKLVEVILTRATNNNIGINERANVARDNGADLFISLHCNGSTNTVIHGPETWIESAANGNINFGQDQILAGRMQNTLNANMPNAPQVGASSYRGIKSQTIVSGVYRDRTQSLNNLLNRPNSRACLMELDWITNPGIETGLISGSNAAATQTTIVNAIAAKIIEDLEQQP